MLKVISNFAGPEERTGKLYIVATPIGNLEDMTYRAVRILREADWIAAEDTRQTGKLLRHFEIEGRVVSYHEHNKRASGEELIRRLLAGETVALVSDAGLPGISDPGEDLVGRAAEEGVPVIPVPGANAALSALVASGLPTGSFAFIGFLPREKKKRAETLARWAGSEATLLLYEAPHRLEQTLEALLEAWGDRRITIARELTKRYEEFARGTISECLADVRVREPKGEYCLVVQGSDGSLGAPASQGAWWGDLPIPEHVAAYEAKGSSRKEAMRQAAIDRSLSRREVYRALLDEQDDKE